VAEKENGDSRIPKQYRGIVMFLRDAGVAALLVALILLAMFAFTGKWPPLVVVESNSMMHGEENLSHIGVIDTGDLVLVKKVDSVNDIETYVDGYVSGHKTYGDYGDVIVYKVDGEDSPTPIIHRTIVYLEVNPDGVSYTVDALRDLPSDKWSVSGSGDTWDHLTSTLTIREVGYSGAFVVIDIAHLSTPFKSGYITKGDHNSQIDQYSGRSPVQLEWVVGMARGEIPWFGLLKLWSTHTLGSPEPENSVRNLWISIAVVIIAPIMVDLAVTYKEKKDIREKKTAAKDDEEKPEEVEKGGGGGRP
jgi:signal peptidase